VLHFTIPPFFFWLVYSHSQVLDHFVPVLVLVAVPVAVPVPVVVVVAIVADARFANLASPHHVAVHHGYENDCDEYANDCDDGNDDENADDRALAILVPHTDTHRIGREGLAREAAAYLRKVGLLPFNEEYRTVALDIDIVNEITDRSRG